MFGPTPSLDKQEERNKEIAAHVESIKAAVALVDGLRFEPREIHLASGDRKRSIIGKAGVITSFAHFVIFAELGAEQRTFERVKQVRDALDSLKINTTTTKIIDGPVGLFIRRPSQHRGELLARIFEDLEIVKAGLGPDFELLASGLNGGVHMRTCSETEVELWIDYSFTIRSVRELTAKKS